MTKILFYWSMFTFCISLADSFICERFTNYPRRYYSRIISAVVNILLICITALVIIPRAADMGIYELYIQPEDRLMYLCAAVFIAVMSIHIVKLLINIWRLHTCKKTVK